MVVESVIIDDNNEVIRKGSKISVKYKSTGTVIQGTLISINSQYIVVEVRTSSIIHQKMISTNMIGEVTVVQEVTYAE